MAKRKYSEGRKSFLRSSFIKALYYSDKQTYDYLLQQALEYAKRKDKNIPKLYDRMKSLEINMESTEGDLQQSNERLLFLTERDKKTMKNRLIALKTELFKIIPVMTQFIVRTLDGLEILEKHFTPLELQQLPLTYITQEREEMG